MPLTTESRMVKVESLYDLLNEKNQQFSIADEAISIDISYGYQQVQQESLIKSKFIKEGQIEIVINLWVHMLSKILWKSVKDRKDRSVYFDKFFSNYSLVYDHATKGFSATCTTRNGRIMKCFLVDVKRMKKSERGSFATLKL